MELQHLITFNTIVQLGTFSKAAEKLGYSQAAVTIQVAKLEDELGTRLFDRLGKSISLTSDGRTFHAHAVRILNDISDAKESVSPKDGLEGTLTIGTVDSLCTSLLLKPVAAFHKKYPGVQISLTTDSIDGLLRMLRDNEIDFAYLTDEPIRDLDLVTVMEREERAVFVCSADHPLAARENVSLQDVFSSPMILTERDASYRMILERDLRDRGIELNPVIESRNTDLIMSMVRQNMGITFLPEYMLENREEEEDVKVIQTGYHARIFLQVLHHKNKWVSQEMKAFFGMLAL
jgi:DNA-binding transcriptional LysR family regulator